MKEKNKRGRIGRWALTKEQVDKLMRSFDRVSDKALIGLAIATGIRRNDIVHIRREDIDFDKGRIKFQEHKKRRIWEVVIPSDEVISLLKQHINTSRKSDWLFPSPKTTGKFMKAHMSDRQAWDTFNEALIRCGISQRPFHALRATCVKQCLANGWSWEAISELTGDLISTLQYHYATPSVGEMQKLAKEKQIL